MFLHSLQLHNSNQYVFNSNVGDININNKTDLHFGFCVVGEAIKSSRVVDGGIEQGPIVGVCLSHSRIIGASS